MRWLLVSVMCVGWLPLLGQSDCRALRGATFPASVIGPATSGAYVKSAKWKKTGGARYCRVLGGVRPVDPAAQDIRFEVNLPEKWNGKAVHFGGGAFDGYLAESAGKGQTVVSVRTAATPLQRGYATFGGDSGHHKRYFPGFDILNVVNASFATNLEERRNFERDALKKTHDIALAVIERRYRTKPKRMFFLGGSNGGREAYYVTQRWPQDYDGVLGAYASWNEVELDLEYIRIAQAMYAPAGHLGRGQTKLLVHAAMEACDGLDGVKDGIISNPAACHWDPATLLCTATKARGCLNGPQLHTVETFASEQRTTQPLKNGVQSIPGFNVLAGADLTGWMGWFQHPERNPKLPFNSFYYLVGDGVLRYFVTGDPTYDALQFNPTTGGKYMPQILSQSRIVDASESDLTPFARHGGKLILLHGTADTAVPTNATVQYYRMLERTMSPAVVDRFVRFYLVPGYGHGGGVFNAGFDGLGALDSWVETGVAPKDLIVTDNNTGRTRPLCEYPAWPRYNAGDVDTASSYACVKEQVGNR